MPNWLKRKWILADISIVPSIIVASNTIRLLTAVDKILERKEKAKNYWFICFGASTFSYWTFPLFPPSALSFFEAAIVQSLNDTTCIFTSQEEE